MPSRSDRRPSDRATEANPAARRRLAASARLAALSLLAAAGLGGLAVLVGPQADAEVVIAREVILGDEAQPGTGKESNEPVYVRDSAIAQEKLGLARRMESKKEWHKSADVYQEVLEKYPDRVVALPPDAFGVKSRYTSVTTEVLASLCKWPQEGLDVYRGRYEPKAAELVNNARADDLFSLHKAFGLYFVTESGKQAGMRLIDAHLEKGEYAAAAWIGDQLLDVYPAGNMLVERPAVLFRTALAYHLAGNKEKAQERSAQLAAKFGKEMGVVRGKDVTLVDALEQELKRDATAVANVSGSDSWPMVAGGPSRGVVSPANASAGTRLFGVPLAKAEFKNINPQQKVAIQTNLDVAAQSGMTLGILPVTDRGELYFQDGQRVYAVSLDSGMPLPGWSKTYGGDRNGSYTLQNTWGSPRMSQQSLTLTDRQVLGVMGQQDKQTMMLTGMSPQGQAEPRLVCLDRATGKENWVVALSTAPDITKNDDLNAVRSLQMSGSPLVVGDNVLVLGRSNKPNQGEDCYVLAFELSTGRYRWGCYVASSGAGAGAAMYGVPVNTADNTSHLAYANGRVYVLTNLGAVAALDAYSGTISWLNIYPLDRPDMMAFRGGFNPMMVQGAGAQNRLKPWMYNPIVVQGGKLFMLPTEGKFLIIYDAGNGKEVKRINLDQLGRWHVRADKQADKPTTLVGVNGDKLVLSGESRVLCIDWRRYDDATFPGSNDEMILWPSVVPGSIRGRPFMTAKSVYVPADDRLRRLDMDTQGSAVEEYPRFPRTWEDGEGPGNVLVTGDHVIIAGANSVDVYTDLAAHRQKLDREIAAAPNDADVRLRYAEVMFVAGQPDAALQRLDEAINLLGGLEKMQAGGGRDRVFSDALAFAQKTAGEERTNNADRVTALYDRAAAAANSPQQHVHYRVSRGKYAEARKDAATSVRLYQEILADPQMRAVSLLDEALLVPALAEDVAEKAIDGLIKSGGTGVYAEYQQQAAKALEEAKAEKNVEAQATKLLAVAQVYPNSGTAAEAMLAAADAYESAKQPRQSIRVLRQMWFKYPQGGSRITVLEAIARNYLAVPDRNRAAMVSTAAARLAQGAQMPGDPKLTKALKLPDGTTVADAGASFGEALEQVRKISGKEADRVLPDFALPIPPTPAERLAGKERTKAFRGQKTHGTVQPSEGTVLPDAVALVLPARDFARADRVVACFPNSGVGIYKAGDLKPLVTNKSFPPLVVNGPVGVDDPAGGRATAAPRGVAWAEDAALVWGGSRLVAIDGKTGRTQWELDFTRLSSLEVVRGNDGPVGVAVVDPNLVNGNNVIINRAGGRVIMRGGMVIGGAAGVVPAPVPPPAPGLVVQPGQPVPPTAGDGEQVVDVRPVGDRVLVTTSIGRLLSADLATGRVAWQTRPADRAPDRLAATEDFTVVKVSDDLTVRLFAFDTFSGRLLGPSKSYASQTGSVPVNLALSPDGTLVYTLPDRLCLKDLYKAWTEEEKVIAGTPGLLLYQGATQPGQLVISEGRILAVADSGGGNSLPPNQKYVRVHSLETGQPLQLKYDAPGDGGKRQIDLVLTAGTKDWNIMLRTVGPRLYVMGPQTVYGYNLDNPAETWEGSTKPLGERTQNDSNFRDAFIGQAHLVLLDQPVTADQTSQTYRLHAYGRYRPNDPNAKPGESGKLDYSVTVTDPAGVAPQWQACDGGFYYTTNDGKVHVLLGSREGEAGKDAKAPPAGEAK